MQERAMLHHLAGRSHSQMMSYFFTTADQKTIVIDGGTAADAPYLREQIIKATGRFHVDAWLLTHAHFDHIDAFVTLMRESGGALDVERIYYHFPSAEAIAAHEGQWLKTILSFEEIFPLFATRATVVHEGDTFTVGQTRITVLHHPDEAVTEELLNNSSVVYRLETAGQVFLFLGDLATAEGHTVLAKHRDALRCDFVQMAHHGQGGVRRDFYEAVKPRACLWDAPDWLWNNDAGKGYNTHTFETLIVRSWMDEMGIVHHFAVCDGDQHIPLPFSF